VPSSADVGFKGKLPAAGDKPAAPPASASTASRGAARAECSPPAVGGALAVVAEEEESLDAMMERLKDLHRKLKTGTAERADAAELEALKRRYEAAAAAAVRSRTAERTATRERVAEMRGAAATATRRKVAHCRVLLWSPDLSSLHLSKQSLLILAPIRLWRPGS
jgi:hypothetical protein